MRTGNLIVPRRYAGPPASANGGYFSGLLSRFLPGAPAVRVTLREPPPLETPLQVVVEDRVQAAFGGAVFAEALPAELDVPPVEPVSYDEALATGPAYRGLRNHPFPGCFVCGSARAAPDGLGLRPGPLPGRPGTTAAAWQPGPGLLASPAGPDRGVAASATGSSGAQPQPAGRGAPSLVGVRGVYGSGAQETSYDSDDTVVPTELVWAALDCPGGWTLDLVGRPAVLGRMTAAVDARPRVGDRCVILGRLLGTEGRKSYTTTTMYDEDERVLARAHAVWVAVDPATFGQQFGRSS